MSVHIYCKNCGYVLTIKPCPIADQRAKDRGFCCADCMDVWEAVKASEMREAI